MRNWLRDRFGRRKDKDQTATGNVPETGSMEKETSNPNSGDASPVTASSAGSARSNAEQEPLTPPSPPSSGARGSNRPLRPGREDAKPVRDSQRQPTASHTEAQSSDAQSASTPEDAATEVSVSGGDATGEGRSRRRRRRGRGGRGRSTDRPGEAAKPTGAGDGDLNGNLDDDRPLQPTMDHLSHGVSQGTSQGVSHGQEATQSRRVTSVVSNGVNDAQESDRASGGNRQRGRQLAREDGSSGNRSGNSRSNRDRRPVRQAAEAPASNATAPEVEEPMSGSQSGPRKSKGIVVLAIGLPGSGKSSWFKRNEITPLSSDTLRQLLFDDETEQRFQNLVFNNMQSMLRARLVAKRPMNYVDATNLTPEDRREWFKIARSYAYEVHAVYFDVPLEICLQRNQTRKRQVEDDVLRKMAAKLKPPTFEEGFTKITVVRVKKKEEAATEEVAE